MDFFQNQETAHRKTGLLIAYFIAAVVLIVLLSYAIVAGAFLLTGRHDRPPLHSVVDLWNPGLFTVVLLGTLALIGGGSLYRVASLAGGGHNVAEMMGGRPLSSQTTDPDERKILNVVEEMAIAAGTPVPPVYLLEQEDGINAFAAGYAPGDAVIGVTRGCIQNLTRDELQGVIAHEFSHILNGDMRLNIRLIGALYGILLISMTGWIIFRSTAYGNSYDNRRDSDRRGSNPWPLVGLALYVLGYIGVFFGNLIKAAVSRQREFLADASAVQFTRNPDGIAGALKKIGALAEGSRVRASRGPGGQSPVLRRCRRPSAGHVRDSSAARRADPPHRSLVRRRLLQGPRGHRRRAASRGWSPDDTPTTRTDRPRGRRLQPGADGQSHWHGRTATTRLRLDRAELTARFAQGAGL